MKLAAQLLGVLLGVAPVLGSAAEDAGVQSTAPAKAAEPVPPAGVALPEKTDAAGERVAPGDEREVAPAAAETQKGEERAPSQDKAPRDNLFLLLLQLLRAPK